MGSSPDTVTQVSKSEPPSYVKPYVLKLLERGEALSETPFAPVLTPGAERVEPFSADELAGFQRIRDMALTGDPSVNAATAGLSQFLDPNAAFSPLADRLVSTGRGNIIDAFNTEVAPTTSALFQKGGTFGSTAQQELESSQRYGLARALGENEAATRGGFLDRSLAAIGAAPGLAGFRAASTADLVNAGAQQRGLGQAIRDIDFSNLLEGREEPLRLLQILQSAINTSMGGFGKTSSVGPGAASGNPYIGGLGAAGSLAGGIGGLISALGPAAGGAGAGSAIAAAAPYAGMLAFSSKDFKEDFNEAETVIPESGKKRSAFVDAIKKLPMQSWRYKGGMGLGTKKHVGPFAEDWQETFGLGDGKTIEFVDGLGVTLKALQEMAGRVEALEAEKA